MILKRGLEKMLKKTNANICERCGEEMEDIQVCHQRCPNCGNELTCSD